MKFGSVCSGIEAASCAWEPLGWRAAWFSEIAPFPSKVLAHHFPQTPNMGSMVNLATRLAGAYREVDVIVGGTPCQSFSVAGLRGGLADERGNLALEYVRLVDALRPRWTVWENVPGVLSSAGGRDFGAIVGALGELGYGWAYRVLDAQHFGVPQRRRRVFLVGCAGGAAAAGAVLFEPESVRGNSAPRRTTREAVAGTLGGGSGSRGWASDTERMTFVPIGFHTTQDPISGPRSPSLGCTTGGMGVCAPRVVGALSNGAHNGGGLNGQDAYSGRIFAVHSQPAGGADGQDSQRRSL